MRTVRDAVKERQLLEERKFPDVAPVRAESPDVGVLIKNGKTCFYTMKNGVYQETDRYGEA